MKFDVKLELKDLGKRQKALLKKAEYTLAQQVMKDSNKYVPMQDGTLKDSVFTNSLPDQGKVVWNTPYARRRYYEPANLSKTPNPNASLKWFEVAKTKHLKEWIKAIESVGGFK